MSSSSILGVEPSVIVKGTDSVIETIEETLVYGARTSASSFGNEAEEGWQEEEES